MKKIVTAILCAVMLLGAVGCSTLNNGKDTGPISAGDVTLQNAYSTQKVMKDFEYIGDGSAAMFKISAAKGETEAAQIIVTPEKDVDSYSVSLVDLKTSAGDTLSKDNLELFHQKYIEVTNGSGGLTSPLGWYPDILLPLENAIEYKENKIKAGDNQAIFLSVTVPKNQTAGVYTGSFVLNINGAEQNIPVSITIWDFEVNENVNTQSMFLINREDLIYGELDNSLEMYGKYVDMLLNYRISPFLLPASNTDVEGFVEVVKEYYPNPKLSSYAIPPVYKSKADSGTGHDMVALENYILALAKASVETGMNLLDKANLYFGTIDEPEINGTEVEAGIASGEIEQTKIEIRDKFLADTSIVGANKQKVADSILKIRNIMTNRKTDVIENIDTWCPKIDDFDTEYSRSKYTEEEYWWYTCNYPVNPFPSYHIDDPEGLLSGRMMSWMQKDYNVSGNLYWQTALYRIVSFQGGYNKLPADLFGDPMRYPGTNGDGYLVYPGRPYGVDGPIASNRLMSIRDGLEEYEILLQLESEYARISEESGVDFDAQSVLGQLYDLMYNGTRRAASDKLFFDLREQLANIMLLALNDTAVSSIEFSGDKIVIEAISTSSDVILESDVESSALEGGYKKYNFSKIVSGASNFLEVGDGTNTVKFILGGQRKVITDYVTNGTDGFNTASGVSYYAMDGAITGRAGQRVVRATINSTAQQKRVTFGTTDFSAIINRRTQNATFNIYNPSANDVVLAVALGGATNITVDEVILKNGWNTVDILNIYSRRWDILRSVSNINFTVNYSTSNTDTTLYFGDIIVSTIAE